jgi:biopolymer transport protein TolR
LALDAQGGLFLNDRPLSAEQLRKQLQDAARLDPETELQLRADQALPYGKVVEVMALAQKAGLSRIGFVAQPPR